MTGVRGRDLSVDAAEPWKYDKKDKNCQGSNQCLDKEV